MQISANKLLTVSVASSTELSKCEVTECIRSQHVLWIMWMAHPNQAGCRKNGVTAFDSKVYTCEACEHQALICTHNEEQLTLIVALRLAPTLHS